MVKESRSEREHFSTQRLVVKVGSSTITEGATNSEPLNVELIDNIARQCSYLHKNGVDIVIVSSGAVACGRNLLSIKEHNIQDRQVEAVYGQPTLIGTWVSAFRKYGVIAGQALLTENDLEEAKKVLQKSLKSGVIIVNANDAVNKSEMQEFLVSADNDRLAGEVAEIIKADTVLILTDADGVLSRDGELIEDGFSVSDEVFYKGSKKGTGGMLSKVLVLRELAKKDVKGVIAGVTRRDIILEVVQGRTKGISTVFQSK